MALILQCTSFRRLCLGLLLCVTELTGLSEALECSKQDQNVCDSLELQNDSDLSLLQRKAGAQHLSKSSVDEDLKTATHFKADGANTLTATTSSSRKNLTRLPPSNNVSVSMSSMNGSKSNGSAAQTHNGKASSSPFEQLYTMMLVETQSSMNKKWIIIIACCVGAFFAGAISTVVIFVETAFSKFFGELIARSIHFVADEILGLDISFGSMSVGIFRGHVLIDELMIANPPGWKSDHFLEIKSFSVRANLWWLVLKYYTCGIEDVSVDLMLIKDLDLTVETSFSGSNVHDILKIVKGEKAKPKLVRKLANSSIFEKGSTLKSAMDEGMKAAGTSLKAAAASCTQDPAEHAQKKDGMKECEFTIHQLTLADIGATVPLLGRVVIPTIQYDDFDSKFEGKARTVRSILVEVTKALLEKAITLHMK